MNWQIFGTIGYLGILLGVGAVVCWLIHWMSPQRLLCRIALGLVVGALVCAMINSATHVDRIQVDPAERQAAMEALEKAKRQAMLDGRGEEVAQVRFAEDGGDEFLDKAGMDEEDLKYFERNTGGDPAWKKEKKTRGSGAEDEGGLEDLIDDEEQAGGADVAELEEEAGPEPILTDEPTMVLANRVDRWNLKISRYLVLFAVIVLGLDYLRRANIYAKASLPLPLPSAWLNFQTPMPALVVRPDSPRRSVPEEVSWLARRGDAFVYLTDDSTKASDVRRAWEALSGRQRRMDLLQPGESGCDVDDGFVFEALWFRRGSFVVDSAERAETMMSYFLELLKERRATRARTRQTVHVVWDLNTPVPETLSQALADFGGPAGFSLFVINSQHSS